MASLTAKGRRMASGGLAWGATHSGKTYSNAVHFARRCAMRPARHLLIGANLRLLRGEVIPLIRSVAREYHCSSTKYSHDLGTFRVGPSLVIVVAGDKDGDEDRLRTYHNLDSIMAEEVTAMQPDFYDMALTRQKQPPAPVWASCNPGHPTSWVKRRLDTGRWKHNEMFLLDDNPTLTDQQKEDFAAQFYGTFKQRMIEALWAAPEGLVYPHYTGTDYRMEGQPCEVGVDFGESGTTAAVYAQRTKQKMRGRTVWAHVGEYGYVGYDLGKRTPDEHAEAIKANAPGRIVQAYIDPSAVKLREALVRAHVPTTNAYNDKKGYDITNGALQEGTMLVNEAHCPSYTTEVQSLIWNKHGDAPDPNCSDHFTDASRYLTCGIDPARRAKVLHTEYR